MVPTKKFSVIIVGGSVSGLTLANMLERFDIDYVLLEAHPEIAPQLGASIGLMPNGNRILDQLGLYDNIQDIVGHEPHLVASREPDGRPLTQTLLAPERMSRLLGYRSLFLERSMLLQVLHKSIKHKERIHTKKRVVQIDLKEDRVQVTAQDGSTFEGDIVVGADGIHSKVRQEMWRIAATERPGHFPPDEESRVCVDTKCIFGISKRPEIWPPCNQANVFGRKNSFLIVPGPGDRIYWFLFANVGPTIRGKDIPRYTKEDEAAMVEDYRNDPIHENGAVFGDLYDARLVSVLVPLQEHVFTKWYYRRIITIGDAAHKFDPITGQGGNGAIESAALLVNSLNTLLGRRDSKDRTERIFSEPEIEAALSDVQARRFKRAEMLCNQAHMFQRIAMKQIPFAGFFLKALVLVLKEDLFLGRMAALAMPAARIEELPTAKKRPSAIPFDDELPARPLRDKWLPSVVWLLTVGAMGGLTYLSWTNPFSSSSLGMNDPVSNRSMILLHVAKANIPSLVVWMTEGYRGNNQLSPIRLPSIFLGAAASRPAGLSAVAPLYYLISVLTSSNKLYGRYVPAAAARAIVPAVSIAYALPTVLALLPIGADIGSRGGILGNIWTAAPLLSLLVAKGMSTLSTWLARRRNNAAAEDKSSNSSNGPKATKTQVSGAEQRSLESLERFDKTEVPWLYSTYRLACAASAAVNIGMRVTQWWTGSGPLLSLADLGWRKIFTTASSATLLSSSSLSLYLLYTVWDLRVLGYVTSWQAWKAALGVVGGQLAFGQGATYAGIWWWREKVLADLAG